MNDTSASLLMLFIDTDPIEKEMRGQKHDPVKYPEGAVAKQKQWIEETLASSNAKWKIVVGHHPAYTGGWRNQSKDVANIKTFLEPLFDEYGVDVYLAGHEHHLEHTKPAGHKTHHIISGAASEARPTKLHPNGGTFAAATQGFATFLSVKIRYWFSLLNTLIKFCMKRLFVSSFSLILCSLLFLYTAKAQVLQYTSQSLHAHNDYKQTFPFWEAYQQGYGSIEVDIFLHNNQLLVAHEEAELDTAKTLEKLYLQPLLQCIRKEQHKRNLIC